MNQVRLIRAEQKNKNLKPIRQKVGIVFHFPEHQLFEETVEKDICFGPMNFGVRRKRRGNGQVHERIVGLPEEVIPEKSPFDLSGGQLRESGDRRGMAMDPDVIVLDEPTAG